MRLQEDFDAIVFDFDGVVVNSEPLYVQAEKRLLAEYGIRIPEEDWLHFKGSSEIGFYETIRSRYGITAPIEELKLKGRRYLRQSLSRGLHYFEGFQKFLNTIDSRYKTGMVTATSYEILDWIFNHTAIENPFTVIVAAEDVTHPKPHPEPYLSICEKLLVKPQRIVVIEDSLNGIRAALQAGTITIGFLSSARKADLPGAHYYAGNYRELSVIINNRNNT